MIIIADSGSTKTDWLVVSNDERQSYSGKGVNPFYQSRDTAREYFKGAFPQDFPFSKITAVYYYGAGCSNAEKCADVSYALEHVFTAASISVNHDLLGAARALCKDKPGIACILGTGSNSCIYDGEKVIDNVPSLGFMLGDEGSGGHLGKELVRRYMYRDLPPSLSHAFEKFIDMKPKELINFLYSHPSPNVFLASYCTFLSHHAHEPYIKLMIADCFRAFFDTQICKYPYFKEIPIHFTGSVSFHFSEILYAVASAYGAEIVTIVKKPMEDLADYHQYYFQ